MPVNCAAQAAAGRGFVRMPRAWIDLPISPQAKTLLLVFCASADDKGESYHSYEQLGALVQRSRSSICGYVRELREHGLVEGVRQTFGNGYNYRLLIRLLAWPDMLGGWRAMVRRPSRAAAGARAADARPGGHDGARSPGASTRPPAPCPAGHKTPRPAEAPLPSDPSPASPPDRKSERRVRNAERKDPSGPKNEIHPTKTARDAGESWGKEDEALWRRFRPDDTDPIGSWRSEPDPSLLRHAIEHADAVEEGLGLWDRDTARSKTRDALRRFAAERGLDAPDRDLHDAAEALGAHALTAEALSASMTALTGGWGRHWRRLSIPKALLEGASEAARSHLPPSADRAHAGRWSMRRWIARRWLDRMEAEDQASPDARFRRNHGAEPCPQDGRRGGPDRPGARTRDLSWKPLSPPWRACPASASSARSSP